MQDVERVFISSTWEDLRLYREIAIHVCRRLSLVPIPMEEFGPDTRPSVDVCLAKVDEATVYVGIYAHRYGFVPEGSEISITEMEYDRAIHNGIPVVLFLVDGEYPWLPRHIDEGEKREKLESFKSRIGEKHTYQKFGDLEKFKEDLFLYLPKILKASPVDYAAGLHYVSAIPEPPEPYVAHPYTLLQTRGLVGRQRELHLMTDWIARPEKTDKARVLSVVAIGGMGKSALTWHWFQEIVTQEMSPLAGRIWWSFYESDATFENFVTRALAYTSRRSLEEVKERPLPDREQELLAILDREPFVVTLDGLERILIAYARMDAAYLQDTDIDDETANYVAGVWGLPKSAGQSSVGRHQLRKTADPRVGRFLRKLARVRASRILISTRLYPADLQTVTGQPLPGCFPLFLPGLSDEDTLDLWRVHGARGSREVMLPVFRSFDSHPLLLQILAGEVARFRDDPGSFDAWRRSNPDFDPFALPLVNVQSHVLAVALRGLDATERRTLHVIAGFRMPAGIESLKALLIGDADEADDENKPFATLGELDAALSVLEDRGLLGWDQRANRYDLHPIVRGVTWSGLGDDVKADICDTMRFHFEAMPTIDDYTQVESLEDLTPAIELYNTLIGLGRYDDAFVVFRDRLDSATLWRLSAGRQRVEMLERLFPDGMDTLPGLSQPEMKGYTLNALAQGYQLSGQPGPAVPPYQRGIDIEMSLDDQDNLSVGLSNLSHALRISGGLRSAESSARAAQIIDHERHDRFQEGMSLNFLGLTLAVRGKTEDAGVAFQRSLRIFVSQSSTQMQGVTTAYLADLALWMSDPATARPLAARALELAEAQRHEADFIRAARLQGTAALLDGDLATADERLHHALRRVLACHLVEEELPVLIALAELERRRGEPERAREFLDDVWEPAERGPYPLFHADAMNVLTQLERDAGRSDEAAAAAKRAYELSWCDGPPFAYHWGLEKAKKHHAELGEPEPVLEPFDESKFEPMPEVEIDPSDEFGESGEG